MLETVTEKDNIIRRNMYSDTHRCEFILNGESGIWDVIHVRIPFKNDAEVIIRRAVGDDLTAFYKSFSSKLCSSIQAMDSLHINEPKSSAVAGSDSFIKAQVKNIKQNLLDYIYIEKKEDEASELFAVCRPYEVFFEKRTSLSYAEYLNLAARMVQLTKTLHEQGVYFSYIDPLAIAIRDNRIMLTSLLYCGGEGEVIEIPELYTFKELSPATEAQSLALLAHFLENIASGKGPFGTANGKRITLPEDIYRILASAEDVNTNALLRMSGSILKELNAAIHKEEKANAVEKGEVSW